MRTLNLGIVAHVDAGKTSLTERLLYATGVIPELGSVDDGSTRTDTGELERRRGITIRSAVVSFVVDGTVVNLVDTPGHPDFIAEVERALGVLDGAVLVVSAAEGVQSQTRLLLRALRRLGIPTLVFVNKIDRRGARYGSLLRDLARRLSPDVVPLGAVDGLGTRGAAVRPVDPSVEFVAERDDAVLAAFVAGRAVPSAELRGRLAALTRDGRAHPVLFGSAITGAGTDPLLEALTTLLPAAPSDDDGPPAGTVFKIERGPAGEKLAYVRMIAGRVRLRDRLPIGTTENRVTGIAVFDGGPPCAATELRAGRIGVLRGLESARVGDAIGAGAVLSPQFAPPTLETVVVPARPADRGTVHAALTILAEQDPLINLRLAGDDIAVSLYGEVQKEVLAATLAAECGVAVTFRETTTIHVERLVGTGEAVEFIDVPPNPFLATVGLRVEPGSGVTFRIGVELGSMPPAFFRAVEESVVDALRQGLHGWRVTDCLVTMTHAGYWPRQSHAHQKFDKSMSSTAGDFRLLVPLVLADALRRAGVRVDEPVHAFHLEIPPDTLGAVLPALARHAAVPGAPEIRGAVCVLDGDVPAARVHALQQQLPALTRGEGVLETAFARYRPVQGPPPERERPAPDPLDRRAYLLHVQRRV